MGLLLGVPSLASGSGPRQIQFDPWEQSLENISFIIPKPNIPNLIIIHKCNSLNSEIIFDQFLFDLSTSSSSFSSSLSDQPPMTSNQPPSDQSPSDQSPSDQPPMTSSSSSFQPSVLETKNVNVVPVINLIFTAIGLFIAIFTFSIIAFMNINTRIDNLYTNLGSKIDNGNQEMRELINSSIRDFNSRIDNVNGRIDNMYKAPSIEN